MSRISSRMPGCGREALLEVQEALLVVRDWSKAFKNVREWSGIYPRCPGGPPGCPRVVGRPF